MDIQLILRGLVNGILAAYLIIYALRPAVPYPDLILEVFENLWMFLVLLILNYYVFFWDAKAGVMLLLCVIALVFDYLLFTQKGYKKVMILTEKFQNMHIDDDDVNADILHAIKKYTEKPIQQI
jgi:hypothetical protein